MATRYTFGPSEFDPRRGVVRTGARACALRPRTAAVLEHLLQRPGALVTREELLRSVWSGRVVTGNSLEQCVSELRHGLAGSPGFRLRTVARRGYVLEAEVRSAAASPVVRSGGSRTIAVLPLLAHGGNGSVRFAEGLTRELADAIGRSACVEVVSPATARRRLREGYDVRALGRDLGLDYVLEGNVEGDAGGWSVLLCAFETTQARQVWSERFRQPRGPEAQARIAIAGAASHLLAAGLTAAESGDGAAEGPRDVRAMVKRAYHLAMQALPGLSAHALQVANEAAALDPHAAGPRAMLAHWHLIALATRAADRPAHVAAAEAAARHAITLDAEHRLAYAALGGALMHAGRLEQGVAAIERQMALNPHVPGAHHFLGRLRLLRGEAHLAIEPVERALLLAPRDVRRSLFLQSLATVRLHLGNDRAALDIARRGVAEPTPWPQAFETLAAAAMLNGEAAEARAAVGQLLELWPGYSARERRADRIAGSEAFLDRDQRIVSALEAAGLPRG